MSRDREGVPVNAVKSYRLRITATWLVILLLASFALGLASTSEPLTITALPHVPKQGEPVIATFTLNNPSLAYTAYVYKFYANGKLVMEGTTSIAPLSSKQFTYAYKNPLQLGEQINFFARVESANGVHEKGLSMPAYPPQLWSSFVSFASFSTSLMSYMTTMAYYSDSFGQKAALNVGVYLSIVLIILLIYLELTEPGKTLNIIGKLRIRFNRLSAVLFIIFMGMVFTQIALIISRVR